MPGEVVVPARMVQAGAVDHLRGKLPGFASGGTVGGLTSAVPWAAAVETTAGMNAATTAADSMIAEAKAKISAAAAAAGKFSATPVTGLGVANLIPYFDAALKDTDTSGSWLNDLITIASYESGLNVNAINLTDSNAAAGGPVEGPHAGHRDDVHPRTTSSQGPAGTSTARQRTLAAAINYIKSRYGTCVFNVPGIVSLSHGGGYVGYGAGGLVGGMAAGGAVPTAAMWLNQLRSGQASEYSTWAGLYKSFQGHTRGAAGPALKALAGRRSPLRKPGSAGCTSAGVTAPGSPGHPGRAAHRRRSRRRSSVLTRAHSPGG